MKGCYVVIAEHGEHDTLFHVVDRFAPESEQPYILSTYHAHGSYRNGCGRGGRLAAQRCADQMNADMDPTYTPW